MNDQKEVMVLRASAISEMKWSIHFVFVSYFQPITQQYEARTNQKAAL